MILVVLMAWYSSSGCEGRCDAKCYSANGGKCDCICGGLNHGVGVEKAMDNTRTLAEAIKEHFDDQCKAKEKGGVYVDPSVYQHSIFGWLREVTA